MATNQTQNDAEKKAAANAKKAEAETTKKAAAAPKFTLGEILERPDEFTGLPLHLIVGAYHDVDLDTQVTVDEVKERVAEWLDAPIDEDAR